MRLKVNKFSVKGHATSHNTHCYETTETKRGSFLFELEPVLRCRIQVFQPRVNVEAFSGRLPISRKEKKQEFYACDGFVV